MKTIQDLANEMLAMFQTKTRDNGESFVSLKDERPDWMQDVCFAAHGKGNMLPDDTRYEMIQEALEAISNTDEETASQSDAADQLDADIYTADLLAWVSSRTSRSEYVDEAVSQGLVDLSDFSLVSALQAGQLEEKREVCDLVWDALSERLEEIEAEEESQDEAEA